MNGREYIPLSNDLISVELAYDCMLGEKFLFDLVVINESGHPYLYNRLLFTAWNWMILMGILPAFFRPWLCHRYSHSSGMIVPLSSRNTRKCSAPSWRFQLCFMEVFVAPWNEGSSARTISGEERESLLKDAIRQEMMQELQLAPGEVANGFVWFPGSPETKYLLFCFPLDEQEFQFAYEVENNRRKK